MSTTFMTCPDCDGTGRVAPAPCRTSKCWRCSGTGAIVKPNGVPAQPRTPPQP